MSKVKIDDYKIKSIMSDVELGKFNIPRFQRDFVWKPIKIIRLMESIQSDFPIGSLLVSSSSDSKLDSGRNEIIDSITGGLYKNNGQIVVDGQQRLTSLIVVYFAPTFAESIIRKKITGKSAKTITSTLRQLAFFDNDFVLLKKLVERFEEEGNSPSAAKARAAQFMIDIPEINKKVQELLNSKDLFIQTLEGWSDKEIIKIFTAMNTKTEALTHIDLMNGAMFNASEDNFDLLTKIKESNKIWSNFGELSKGLFVQLIKIYSDLKLTVPGSEINYKADKLVAWAMRDDKVNGFVSRYQDFENTIMNSLAILDRKLDIYTIKNMPKEVYLLVVFSLVCKIGEGDPRFDKTFNSIISWVSRRLIIGHYASSPNAKAMDDINKKMIKEINGEEVTFDPFNGEDTWREALDLNLKDLRYSNKSQALFKLFNATLSSQNPFMLFKKGEKVPVRPTEVTKLDTDIHHFIPTNSESSKRFMFGDRLNVIGNLTLITADENRNEIRNREVNEYLKESENILGDLFKASIESHLFDYDLIKELMEIDFEKESSVKVNTLIERIFNDRRDTIAEKIISKFIER